MTAATAQAPASSLAEAVPAQPRARASTSREPYYDGIRGLAILGVLGVHWVAPYAPGFLGGYVGVDVFFVLSGFVITRSLWMRPAGGSVRSEYRRFMAARCRRLLPALLALLVVGGALVATLNPSIGLSTTAVSALIAITQTASPARALGLSAVTPFGHTWSLSVEWLFYVAWPLVLMLARRRGVTARTIAMSALAVAVVLYLVAATGTSESFYYGPFARIAQILVGASLAVLPTGSFERSRRVRLLPALAAFGLLGLVCWTLLGPSWTTLWYRWVGFPAVTAAAFLLLAMPAAGAGSALVRAIGCPPLRLLGLVSYSLYLWHTVALTVLTNQVPLSRLELGAIAVTGTAVATCLSYRFLERPYLRRRSG